MEDMKCTCIGDSIKRHLEGALIYYIRGIQRDVAEFARAAIEYKNINPELSKHYSQLVESQNAFLEEIEAAKRVVKALPICEGEEENPHPKRLTVPEQHQLKIARDTLKMSDVGARIMGGPTKEEAREIIKKLTGQVAKE